MKTTITNISNHTTTKKVWVVTIPLNYEIIAVGTTKAKALHSAGVKAAEYLAQRNNLDENCEPWTPATIAEYFGYGATECDIDGIGQYH